MYFYFFIDSARGSISYSDFYTIPGVEEMDKKIWTDRFDVEWEEIGFEYEKPFNPRNNNKIWLT